MKLYFTLTWIFFKELRKEFKKEEADPGYKNQKNYATCIDRSLAMLEKIFQKIKNILALAIAFHREKDHGEDHSEEITKLTAVLSAKEVIVASKRWWKA